MLVCVVAGVTYNGVTIDLHTKTPHNALHRLPMAAGVLTVVIGPVLMLAYSFYSHEVILDAEAGTIGFREKGGPRSLN